MIKKEIIIDYKGFKNQKVTIDDMPNQLFIDIAETCGVDVAVSLLNNFNGNTILVPLFGMRKLEKRIIFNEYAKEFNSECIRKLARRLFISERAIRDMLKDTFKILPADGQLNLFKGEEE